MSTARDDTIERPKVGRITEPAKRWRNRWLAMGTGWATNFSTGGQCFVRKGETVESGKLFPSRDLAETEAQRIVRYNLTRAFQFKHLGAFPVQP